MCIRDSREAVAEVRVHAYRASPGGELVACLLYTSIFPNFRLSGNTGRMDIINSGAEFSLKPAFFQGIENAVSYTHLLNRLNAERADLAAAVPEDSLGEYERMTRSKGVPVIVPMDEKRCV